MILTRRSVLSAAAASLGIGALAACSGDTGSASSSASGAPRLVIGLTYVPDIQFSPVYVADHFGWFAEEGLDATIRHHGAQETLFGALSSGEEDLVYAGGDEMMQARSQGVPVVNFATSYQTHPAALLVADDSPITSIADLRGRTVGLPGEYGENWFYLLAALKQAGLTTSDVTVSSIGYTQFSALTEGHVDAVVGFRNSDLVRLETSGFATRVLEVPDLPLIGIGFGVLDDTLDQRAEQLSGFLAAMRRAVEYCVNNPEETVELCSEYVETLTTDEQKAYALEVLKATNALYGQTFGAQNPQTWTAMADFMADQDLLGGPVDATEVFTTSIS